MRNRDWCGGGARWATGCRQESRHRLLPPEQHIVPFLMQKDQWHIWKAVTRARRRSGSPEHRDRDELGENVLYLSTTGVNTGSPTCSRTRKPTGLG